MEYDTENKTLEMIEQFVVLQDQKVLEIGCGEGHISKLLAFKTRQYIAIDPDEQCIEKAKSEIQNVDFRIGNGESLQFEDESFFSLVSFTDLDELCNYPFGRDTVGSEDHGRIIETLQQLQGAIAGKKPIHLHDDSHIFLLRKESA